MLKKVSCFLMAAVLLCSSALYVHGLSADALSAKSAVVICAETGDILFEKNAYEKRSMASTTKIMTSLLAVEANTPDRIVTATAEAVNVEGSSSGLKENDRLRLCDLVYCMMLESGNEAANTTALALGGSFENFAATMNQRAAEIGMRDTSFVTPSGLDDENHYTTAYDMALLAAEAAQNEAFMRISSAKSHKVTFFESDKTITLYNHNRLLSEFEGCVGMKTGFTKKSGRCLVSAARRNGVTLIAVTLNAPDDWNDHKKMLNDGFEKTAVFETDNDFSSYAVKVTGSEKLSVTVAGAPCAIPYSKEKGADIETEIYLEKFLYAPVKKGDVVGWAVYRSGGKTVRAVPLTAAESADVKQKQEQNTALDRLFGLFDSWWKHGRQ